ncbi:MAG: hypothetical protein DMF86_14090 [Acidobacteria bacterium]|nr:MAG: hypothetical protein DMF86_14090 [Acidobacteriota bacterium]
MGGRSGAVLRRTSKGGFVPRYVMRARALTARYPGASIVNVQRPPRRPSIENFPLASVVEVELAGAISAFSAVIVAPLMARPPSSFTVPVTRPCAAAVVATSINAARIGPPGFMRSV